MMIQDNRARDRGYDLLRWITDGEWLNRTLKLNETTISELRSNGTEERTSYILRPSKNRDRSGLDTTLKLWNGFYEKIDHSVAFEIRHTDKTRLYISIPTSAENQFETLMEAFFPGCEVEIADNEIPNMNSGHHVAGARLGLRQDYFLPILNPVGVSIMKKEPYNEIIKSMEETAPSTRTAVQVAFKPAPENWYERRVYPILPDSQLSLTPFYPTTLTCDEFADSYGEGVSEQAKSIIAAQQNKSAFIASIRVFAWARNRDAALKTASTVASTLAKDFTDPELDQGFEATALYGREIPLELNRYVNQRVIRRRQWFGTRKREPCILTTPELTSLAHIPSQIQHEQYQLDASSMDWGNGAGGPTE